MESQLYMTYALDKTLKKPNPNHTCFLIHVSSLKHTGFGRQVALLCSSLPKKTKQPKLRVGMECMCINLYL